MPATKITTQGFLSEFLRRHKQMSDRPFCWVLGSGASIQSGIPAGGALALQWLKELHEMEDADGLTLEAWATERNLQIKGFDFNNAANFYPFIYQRRFRDFKEQGYAFLEDSMAHADPSYGYSVLAQIMAGYQHKVAVTTNFDNLIADAISIYTDDFPLVCGHESLTGFIRPNLKRPVVAKIHRDLLLSPKSEPEEIEILPPEWEQALQVIFQNNTPIVIGYGGNDGSLMGFLKKIAPIKGGIFWCHRTGREPDTKIQEIVEHHHGRLVPISGFDELMLQLWEKLKLPSPIPQLQATHDKRKTEFQNQFEELNKKLKRPGETKIAEVELKEVRAAAESAIKRLTKEPGWWSWQLAANAQTDPAAKEAVFREGLADLPSSAELTCNFAIFMADERKNYDEAERLFRRALELDAKNPTNICNFAIFIKRVRKNYEEAERLYRKALELDPQNARTICRFAMFMANERKNYAEAERLYRKALELEPTDADNMCSFAMFLANEHKSYDEAERLYRKALEVDPTDADNTCRFAMFMANKRKNYDEAERLYRKALELDPTDADNTCSFAMFMSDKRKNNDEAERLHRKALELDPTNADNTCSFAIFMADERKNYDEAERLYRKALELDPTDADNTCRFAMFMANDRKNYDEAERLYRKSLELDPMNPDSNGAFGVFMYLIRKDNKETERLCREALKLNPEDPHYTANFAFFNWKERQDYDQAESLYCRAFKLGLKDAFHANNFAKFMEEARKNYSEASRLFRFALELDPNDEDIKNDYIRFKKEHPEIAD